MQPFDGQQRGVLRHCLGDQAEGESRGGNDPLPPALVAGFMRDDVRRHVEAFGRVVVRNLDQPQPGLLVGTKRGVVNIRRGADRIQLIVEVEGMVRIIEVLQRNLTVLDLHAVVEVVAITIHQLSMKIGERDKCRRGNRVLDQTHRVPSLPSGCRSDFGSATRGQNVFHGHGLPE
ncbi:MAG: hypothetical protein JOZ87_34515 [Chloroflexi bacterium]|nr:hypothetical protein [Chloroflexota bacterium]